MDRVHVARRTAGGGCDEASPESYEWGLRNRVEEYEVGQSAADEEAWRHLRKRHSPACEFRNGAKGHMTGTVGVED